MQNRIASLFALDELLGAKINGHNGNGGAPKRRRKRRRAPNAGAPASASPAKGTYSTPKHGRKTLAQSYDTGAPIRCEHGIAYTPAEPVQLPVESTPGGGGASAMSFGADDGYTVEAFEEEEDEEDLSTALPDLDAEASETEDYAAEAVRASSYEPSTTPSRGDYEHTKPAAFAAQMTSVEQDLADLAARVQQPAAPNAPATPSAGDGEDEQSTPERVPPPAPASGHGVFDSMAKGMTYATEFRLPAVQLSQVFSALDKEIDAEAVRSALVAEPRPVVVSGPAPSTAEPLLPNEVLIKDLTGLPSSPAPEPATAVAAAAIDVRHDVQLVPQLTGFSCWAAGAAMLVGWRDQMSIDPSEIARATGYWAQYKTGLHPEDVTMFKVWRLTPEPAQTYTVQGFAELLKKHGPLWVASAEPGPHIRVVTGMVGDGTPTGTLVYINDPWEQGMQVFRPGNRGSRYTETYQRFVEKQNELGRREITLQGIYVAHN